MGEPTTQDRARNYVVEVLKEKNRERVEEYLDNVLGFMEAPEVLTMTAEALVQDFEIFLEIIKELGDRALRGEVDEPTPVEVEPRHTRGRTFVDLTETYVESIQPGFVCPKCRVWFPEDKGHLARPAGINTSEQAALYDMPCIIVNHLILEPEEKDRKR